MTKATVRVYRIAKSGNEGRAGMSPDRYEQHLSVMLADGWSISAIHSAQCSEGSWSDLIITVTFARVQS